MTSKLVCLMIGLVICFQAISADVKTVKKGDTVPFDGVLFTKELEKSIREDIQVNERKINILTKLNDLNEKEIDILTKRLVVHQKVASEFATREVNSENNAFWKNALYFISGAVITGFIHYGANR